MDDLTKMIQQIAKDTVREELEKLTTPPPPPLQESGGIELAIELTGLSKSTIYKLVHRRKIPHSKPSGTKQLRFSRARLQEWVKSGAQQTEEELSTEALRINRL